MKLETVLHHYNEDHNTTSANAVVPYILEYIQPTSVIDIGCGLGQWLHVFEKHGAQKVVGIDGSHVPKEMRKIDDFIEFDLTSFGQLRELLLLPENAALKKFDLCVNLEVAEHLPEESAEGFITFLTELSDCILFSAAIPFQTGENHINEKPHKYWSDLFAKKGYVCCDIFRKKFWNDDSVNWWYRQNMFLFIECKYQLKQMNFLTYDGNEYIHPEMLKIYTSIVNGSKNRIIRTINAFVSKVMFWK